MDTLFHFVFPIIAALAARLNVKHPIKTIFAAALITILIDIDHFIGFERGTFHNVFITILIPLIFLIISFPLKLNRYFKGFFFLLLIFLSSHLFIDLFSSPVFGDGIGIVKGTGVSLFYPLSRVQYSINFNVKVPLETVYAPNTIEGYVISSLGFGMLIYFIIIVAPCLFLDDIIEIAERKNEKFMNAASKFFKGLLRD